MKSYEIILNPGKAYCDLEGSIVTDLKRIVNPTGLAIATVKIVKVGPNYDGVIMKPGREIYIYSIKHQLREVTTNEQ